MVKIASECVIVDNGGCLMKVGLSADKEPRCVPNYIVKSKHERKRVYVSDELEECADRSSLFFVLPFERGYLVNWDVEQQVWEKAFSSYADDFSSLRIAITDPNYLIPATKDLSDEILFESFGFHSVFKSSASGFSALPVASSTNTCVLVVDCGYSCCIITPFHNGKPIQRAIIRIDIGGKALTNQLKEWISYRELNVLDETYVINECKEDACYVSLNFERDMAIARLKGPTNTIKREYVLPDFVNHQRGYLKDPSTPKDGLQTFTLNHERFSLPEALFRPSDVGLMQMGVAEATAESLNRVPENLASALAQNIILVGGSTKFPGFRERFYSEVSALLNSCWTVKLRDVANPITEPWMNAKHSISSGAMNDEFYSKESWLEYGDSFYNRFIHFL